MRFKTFKKKLVIEKLNEEILTLNSSLSSFSISLSYLH